MSPLQTLVPTTLEKCGLRTLTTGKVRLLITQAAACPALAEFGL